MKCPYCGEFNSTHVVGTTPEPSGGIRRRRECNHCGSRFSTYERPVLATPRIIKSGGYREDFSREKLMRGLQTACVKRPVSTQDLEQLADRIEDTLQQMGQLEVDSKLVGDLVVEGLKELDEIAYIRYTIVYLKLDSVNAIRAEIDKLMKDQAVQNNGTSKN